MNTQLHAQQKLLTEMLKVIDQICKKNEIPYMLFAGTALGAVRHKGFIPWDDDLDVIMLRSDYERFLKAASKDLDKQEFYLQQEFSEHWPMFFSKLRKNGTACIERYIPKDPKVHQGIYIDIFPCDNLSEWKWVRRMQFLAARIVVAKSLDKRGYLTDSKLKKVFIFSCRCIPQKLMSKIARLESKTGSGMVHTFFAASSKYKKNIFPREWFTETVDMNFEDGKYPVSRHYDKLLTQLYGDYMTEPPENERGCKVHGEIVDIENSYEKYVGIQKGMDFQEYTRSIR